MRKGLALLLLNMLSSEFGYKLEWVAVPDGKDSGSFRLVKSDSDFHEFSGDEKFEEAVQWLREKA